MSELEEDDIEIVPIALGRQARANLKRFAALTGQRELDAAGILLSDLLRDDEFWKACREEGACGAGRIVLN
jgi:hypothetical protein